MPLIFLFPPTFFGCCRRFVVNTVYVFAPTKISFNRPPNIPAPGIELMLYQALTTVSVVMNILMHTVLDTKSDIILENSFKEGYTIGHDK